MDFLNDYNGQIMEEDIEFIKTFLTNVIEKKENDTIILLYGDNACGKTRLINQIINYIGSENVYTFLPNHYDKIKSLIALDAWIDTLKKNDLNYLRNLCIYKQSIIMTRHIRQNIPEEIEYNVRIIDM